jgi:CheY-like chemotaxis protein
MNLSPPLLPFRLRRPSPPRRSRFSGDADRRLRQTLLLLIASSYADAKNMCLEHLQGSGFQVVVALDGAEAVDVARAVRPGLIFMDTWTQSVPRLQALRRLKQDPVTVDIPVVAFVAAHTSDQVEAGWLAAGCADVLIKPCLPEDILLFVLSRLRMHD